MSKIYLQTYGAFSVSGKDFPTVISGNEHRLTFSPDNVHSITLNFLRNGLLLFNNPTKTKFDFTIARNKRSMVLVKFRFNNEGQLFLNNNFRISKEGVSNREIHENPNTMASNVLHLNFTDEVSAFGRADLKVDESGFAACIFTDIQLLFVRMNGNHAVPRINEFVQREVIRAPPSRESVESYIRANPEFAKKRRKSTSVIGSTRMKR